MNWPTRKDIEHNNTRIEEHGLPNNRMYQRYRSLPCRFGIHRGEWNYTIKNWCEQTRVCIACGQSQTRIRHEWDHKRDYASERRECTRCGKIEIWGRTRENLVERLHSLGVNAELAKRGRPEENTGIGSMGLIEIEKSPISWINVRAWDNEGRVYGSDYGIPDSRPLPDINIRSVRVRSSPLFGAVIDVRWKGNILASSVAQHLTSDQTISAAVISNRDEITIRTSPDYGCWIIPRTGCEAPNPAQWECYLRIARKLLTAPLT